MDTTTSLLVSEGLLGATAAFRSLGIHVSVWSILRWIRHGVRKRRLEAVRVGGRWFTSVPAVQRFLERRDQPSADPEGQRARVFAGDGALPGVDRIGAQTLSAKALTYSSRFAR